MAVTIIQAPTLPFDQAYGPNPVTLTGIPTNITTGAITADKYVLQIFRAGVKIADLRQTPNQVGNAIFDIQNTLQNFVAPSPNNVEEVGYIGASLMNSAQESTPYSFAVGSETGGIVSITGTSSLFLDFGGTKKYYEVPYDPSQFIPVINQTGVGCTFISQQGQPFTDLKEFRLGADITDGKPIWLLNNMRVYDHYVTRSDMTTISYYNSVTGNSTPANVNSIDAFVFWQYSNNTFLSSDIIYNIIGDGGGPNQFPGQGLIPAYPTNAITVGTGPLNFQDFDNVNTTHYYVASSAFTECTSTNQNLTDNSMHYVHRFNIIDEACNDFPEYQFSWLNSYGFRDYFSFRKRKDRSVKIKRNEYLREAANYNSTSYNVNIYDRGTTVYSQDLPEEFNAFTNYLSDADALYLQGLFTSADVKVRFNDSDTPTKWVPVSLMSTDYVEKTVRKDKLFQYSIKFALAHNLKSQRG
jgi:hypothetical protein